MRGLSLAAVAMVAGCAATPAGESRPLTDIQERNQRTLERYLAADSPEAAERVLAPTYRPRLLEWDTLLHPHRTISQLAVNEDAAIAVIHEDNDFSRLIEHPGWDGTITVLFDKEGAISGTHFTPTPGKNPSWGPYMDAALPWLREHRAAELEAVFPDHHLRQDAEGARTWTRILREWRVATGRGAVG